MSLRGERGSLHHSIGYAAWGAAPQARTHNTVNRHAGKDVAARLVGLRVWRKVLSRPQKKTNQRKKIFLKLQKLAVYPPGELVWGSGVRGKEGTPVPILLAGMNGALGCQSWGYSHQRWGETVAPGWPAPGEARPVSGLPSACLLPTPANQYYHG